ncbi:MAG: hypothetical protein DCC65_16155 [Planctomycetota bacterium]|nr:MAG: hypothetical protein DCC65_16155 [Planctomycetota bacterium]
MSSEAQRKIFRRIWAVVRLAGRFLRNAVPRIYATAIMFVIVWLTFLAVRYLVTSLAIASGPPPQIVALPTRLDRAALREGRSAFAALDAAEHPRSPLAHYHRLGGWVQPDTFNDCTRSGCHNPLPHAKRKEVRAFLNMHATSIHCGVCHMEGDRVPRPLVWYGLDAGKPGDPPSLLQAYAMLTAPDAASMWKRDGDAAQKKLVHLLNSAARESGDVPALARLAEHFEAYRVGSKAFDQMLTDGPAALARHFRGEYGAKLALRDERTGRPLLGHPNTGPAVAEWFARKDTAVGEEATKLLEAVHPMRRASALTCTDCHRTQGSLIDFPKLGYPEARIRSLIDPVVFSMIEHINAGRPFNLPAVLGGAPLPPPDVEKKAP